MQNAHKHNDYDAADDDDDDYYQEYDDARQHRHAFDKWAKSRLPPEDPDPAGEADPFFLLTDDELQVIHQRFVIRNIQSTLNEVFISPLRRHHHQNGHSTSRGASPFNQQGTDLGPLINEIQSRLALDFLGMRCYPTKHVVVLIYGSVALGPFYLAIRCHLVDPREQLLLTTAANNAYDANAPSVDGHNEYRRATSPPSSLPASSFFLNSSIVLSRSNPYFLAGHSDRPFLALRGIITDYVFAPSATTIIHASDQQH
jgi:hypothetical protein